MENSFTRKQVISVGGAFVAALIAVAAFFGHSSRKEEQNALLPGVVQVALLADRADPDIVALEAGGTVQFNSKDGQYHDIELGEGDAMGHTHDHVEGGFGSGTFGPDEAWRARFTKPGSYFFHDHLNPKISATVIVYVPDATSTKTH